MDEDKRRYMEVHRGRRTRAHPSAPGLASSACSEGGKARCNVHRAACRVRRATCVAVQQRRAKEEKKAAEMQEQIEKMKVSRPSGRTVMTEAHDIDTKATARLTRG